MTARLPVGKLPTAVLERLLKKYVLSDARVLVGPGLGRDAAVIDMGETCLVAKSDPVTFAVDEIGWYAVHVNANDVACCGAVPRWFLATVLLPEQTTTPDLAEEILAQISKACQQLGVVLCGGHTEITHGLNRPIVVGHMLGETSREGYLKPGRVRVGDHVILTKGIAIEGVALIAREKALELQSTLTTEELRRCTEFLHTPGISIVREATAAMESGGVHAMHDPTEGGLATGLWELAQSSQMGIVVDERQVPVLPECERICGLLGLDPLGLLASGSLLIVCAAESSSRILDRLIGEGIKAVAIGRMTSPEAGCRLRRVDGRDQTLPTFERDEIARLFDQNSSMP